MALRKYKRPRLPDGLFCLTADLPVEELDEDTVDGPLDPARQVRESDGTTVFVTEGLPYVLRVVRQTGDLIEAETGTRYRVRPWPLPSS